MWGTIIAALIAAASTTISGIAQNRATKKAEEKSLGLATIARGDELKQTAIETGMKKRQLRLQENQFGYEKMLARELENKKQISNLGSSLTILSKSGMDMQSFINGLYGRNIKRGLA